MRQFELLTFAVNSNTVRAYSLGRLLAAADLALKWVAYLSTILAMFHTHVDASHPEIRPSIDWVGHRRSPRKSLLSQ